MEVTDVMRQAAIFQGLSDEEIIGVLPCVNGRVQEFHKEESLYKPGDEIRRIGLVLEGTVRIEKIDYWGNRRILSVIEPGSIFGESYAGLKAVPMEMEVIASTETRVLFMDVAKILMTCSNSCVFHGKMIRNMVYTLAEKNHQLTRKMEHLTQRSTREKLLSYFSEYAMSADTSTFEIPLDRQELADYQSVDRSAMSTELGKMKKEGIIDFHKNHFKLLKGQLEE